MIIAVIKKKYSNVSFFGTPWPIHTLERVDLGIFPKKGIFLFIFLLYLRNLSRNKVLFSSTLLVVSNI
jgi:hypothetical protein